MKVLRSDPLTEANLKVENQHIYITALRKELPGGVFEIENTNRSSATVTLEYDGVTVNTYVPNDKRTGKPRNHFQARSFIGKFFKKSGASVGDIVLFTELSPSHFRLSLEKRSAAKEKPLPRPDAASAGQGGSSNFRIQEQPVTDEVVPTSASPIGLDALKTSTPQAASASPEPKQAAISRMVRTATETVASANGQTVLKQVKNKDLLVSTKELASYISSLIEAQGALCALSGLPLQFDGAEEDEQMLASLDRIDSNGDYAKGNLQVVCRFINRWKSDMPDPEFRRLMNLVQDLERL